MNNPQETIGTFGGSADVRVIDSEGNVVEEFTAHNRVVDEGLAYMLDVSFGLGGQAVIGQWYMGLCAGSGALTIAAGDAGGSHAGWTEVTVDNYTGNRKPWNPVRSTLSINQSGGVLRFDLTTTSDIRGCFLINHATDDTGSQTLLSVIDFGANRNIAAQSAIEITYNAGALASA